MASKYRYVNNITFDQLLEPNQYLAGMGSLYKPKKIGDDGVTKLKKDNYFVSEVFPLSQYWYQYVSGKKPLNEIRAELKEIIKKEKEIKDLRESEIQFEEDEARIIGERLKDLAIISVSLYLAAEKPPTLEEISDYLVEYSIAPQLSFIQQHPFILTDSYLSEIQPYLKELETDKFRNARSINREFIDVSNTGSQADINRAAEEYLKGLGHNASGKVNYDSPILKPIRNPSTQAEYSTIGIRDGYNGIFPRTTPGSPLSRTGTVLENRDFLAQSGGKILISDDSFVLSLWIPYEDLGLYQSGYGWAPTGFRVTNGDEAAQVRNNILIPDPPWETTNLQREGANVATAYSYAPLLRFWNLIDTVQEIMHPIRWYWPNVKCIQSINYGDDTILTSYNSDPPMAKDYADYAAWQVAYEEWKNSISEQNEDNPAWEHLQGQALDLVFPGSTWNTIFKIAIQLTKVIPFDKIVLNYNTGSEPYIHVSFKRNKNNYDAYTLYNGKKISPDNKTLVKVTG